MRSLPVVAVAALLLAVVGGQLLNDATIILGTGDQRVDNPDTPASSLDGRFVFVPWRRGNCDLHIVMLNNDASTLLPVIGTLNFTLQYCTGNAKVWLHAVASNTLWLLHDDPSGQGDLYEIHFTEQGSMKLTTGARLTQTYKGKSQKMASEKLIFDANFTRAFYFTTEANQNVALLSCVPLFTSWNCCWLK
eukprot:TRINITY_DN5252_c0_g1_i1.p1 TRINITY_DN5252_c0_g1~~TRINITY_DN5252_c0_g1_i1.p1  ORF type:complete len:191 (-),score=46.18 TRINITY_DN5252_c0_g1_i1:188-760(-)